MPVNWTAKVIAAKRKAEDPGLAQVAVEFSDGKTTQVIGTEVADKAQLDNWVLARVAQFDQVGSLVTALPVGTALTTAGPPPPPPPPPPVDPNAGLAPLTIVDLLGLLSDASRAKLAQCPSLDAIRRDVLAQDRPSLTHWIAVLVAKPDPNTDGIITDAEAQALVKALAQPAT